MHENSRGLLVKVCGVTSRGDVDLLRALPVDLVGLWHGVSGGHADLPLSHCRRLAEAARATQTLEPVLVTFLSEVGGLHEVILTSQVRWIQLHGYQPPGLVRALKRIAPVGTRVIKALHVRGRHCLEGSLIPAYEKAGVDVFLFDAATEDGRIGSTGQSLDGEFVSSLAERLAQPFLLAGGISSENWRKHVTSLRHPRFLGIDIDTNARGPDRMLQPQKVEAISRAWKACAHDPHPHVEQVPH
jgi:phosphoribosylanthranilate isomerase